MAKTLGSEQGLTPVNLADELAAAYATGQTIAIPPSARDSGFNLTMAYAVEAELARRRKAAGHRAVGRKVGFANKALWRVLKLDTVVWAHMYDDTVHDVLVGVDSDFAQTRLGVDSELPPSQIARLSLPTRFAPKIEPEIVFKMKTTIGGPETPALDPDAALAAVEWLALGFEIIDCPFPDWKFQPVDFVAAFGFHRALIVGKPRPIEPDTIPALAERLACFKVKLLKDGELVEEGSGRNVLRSPALCLAELASAAAREPVAEPLGAGELVSTGTLTTSQPIADGQTWRAVAEDLDVPAVAVRF